MFFKRLFDISFSVCVLLLWSPILLLIGLSIRISSPGKAIYSCQRVGKEGKLFKFYKFRSMYQDADNKLEDLLKENPDLNEEWKKNHKLKDDPRIIPGGSFLRKSSLDEFLQFWNVLKGDLSVVGPRPYYAEEIENRVGDDASLILSIRPGLTGIWQVSGRSNTTFEKRVELDLEYVKKRHFFLDVKIILKTIFQMFFSRGAY
ncbi:hypothetical protein AB751O23_BC_00040 [Chlamydiales bacterium SCGC AB-751-O23]|nr:hypothetical protein AB751O23_BC_00040 [Chlamydiales bacterium SCGC AB-751-O23]